MIDRWLTLNEIAVLMNIKKDSAKKLAKRKKWPYKTYAVRGGNERRYHITNLPEDVQTAYAASIKLSLTDLQSQLKPALKPDKKINIPGYSGRGAKTGKVKSLKETPHEYLVIASFRLEVIEAYSACDMTPAHFVAAYNSGAIAAEARAKLGNFGDISCPSSLYRWLALFQQYGLAGLAPQYSKRRGGYGASLGAQAKDIIHALFLTPNRPTIKSILRVIKVNKLLEKELDASTVSRYIKYEIPKAVKVFFRLGEKAFKDQIDPYIERDYNLIKPMEWGCADHHLFDFVINHNGRIFRPWLTLFMDMRSRKITGWHIDIVPNTLTIMRAFYMSVKTCGLFENMYVDNGKDFKSTWFAGNEWKQRRTKPERGTLELIKGVLHDCLSKVHFALPYNAKAKGVIERLFGTIIELFSKERSTWIGPNPQKRPEYADLFWRKINGQERVEVDYTLEAVREDFSKFVAWYNAKWEHSGQGMGGQEPDTVFYANLEAKRELPEDMYKYVFAIRDQRTVQQDGIRFDNINYCSDELLRFIGQRVEVRRSIDDIGKVSIFSLPDCVYQFDAENEFFKDRGVPEENARKIKAARKKVRAPLQDYANGASEIRQMVKTPAEIYAEEALKVVGGEPIAEEKPSILELVTPETKPKKKRISIWDVD